MLLTDAFDRLVNTFIFRNGFIYIFFSKRINTKRAAKKNVHKNINLKKKSQRKPNNFGINNKFAPYCKASTFLPVSLWSVVAYFSQLPLVRTKKLYIKC